MVAYKAEQGGERQQVAELCLWELLCQAKACLWSSAELRMAEPRWLHSDHLCAGSGGCKTTSCSERVQRGGKCMHECRHYMLGRNELA